MRVETFEIESAGTIIELALAEDVHDRGDITNAATIDADATADVHVVARQSGVLSGAVLLNPVYQTLAARCPDSVPCEVSLHRTLLDSCVLLPPLADEQWLMFVDITLHCQVAAFAVPF